MLSGRYSYLCYTFFCNLPAYVFPCRGKLDASALIISYYSYYKYGIEIIVKFFHFFLYQMEIIISKINSLHLAEFVHIHEEEKFCLKKVTRYQNCVSSHKQRVMTIMND